MQADDFTGAFNGSSLGIPWRLVGGGFCAVSMSHLQQWWPLQTALLTGVTKASEQHYITVLQFTVFSVFFPV